MRYDPTWKQLLLNILLEHTVLFQMCNSIGLLNCFSAKDNFKAQHKNSNKK